MTMRRTCRCQRSAVALLFAGPSALRQSPRDVVGGGYHRVPAYGDGLLAKVRPREKFASRVELVLSHTGVMLFPIPAQQHRARHPRRVHRAQKLVDLRKPLHRAPIFPHPRAQFRPMFFPHPQSPRFRSKVHLRRIKVNMAVGEEHGTGSKAYRIQNL